MLILERHIGEKIRIGDDVVVVVVSVKGGNVRLGVEAPASVAVHREELFLRIKDQERSGSSDTD